ncbi:dihydrofolate reductase family protein [Rhizobium leguminosarum]|uniref:dihydrofolate reductase family protein n=1 Tax=Rhizobium leguminosarum TaxID=384 RepID=UPI003F9B9C8E
MRPHVICLMLTSPDGGLHPSQWTSSPDGSRADWSALYEKAHENHAGDAWLVGRETMAEISKAEPHPPSDPSSAKRPIHFAEPGAKSFAIALDRSGKLHFSKADLYGDHVVVLLGSGVSDAHLAELEADGVSYVVSDIPDIDVGGVLDLLSRQLGIKRLILEGGANVNGRLIAEGFVDELSLIVAPALDARLGGDRFVEFGAQGLAGKVELSLISCDRLDNGAVHLRYAMAKPSPSPAT